jgi:sarcosine oxidase subunit beta
MGNRTADAVVIGAGVIGCSVAHALAVEGLSVLVVERAGAPGMGSTSASSAIIRFNYSTFAGVATAWEAHYAWAEWEAFLGGRDDDGGLARFIRTGAICLDSPTHDPGKVLALFDRVGVPYEVWDAATLRARLPQLDPARHYPPKPVDSEEFWADPQGEVGAYWTPDGGFVDDPGYAAHNLATAARRRGVRFAFRTTVTGIASAGGRVAGVDLADGTRIDAPVVVNVAGPASGAVNALAGVGEDFAVATRPMRAEVHTVPGPPGYHGAAGEGAPGPLVADLDLGTYFRGTPSGELLIGGAEPACDPLHWLADPEDYETGPTAEQYRAQLYRAARRLPGLTVPNTPRGIGAVYDVADDWIPIYDRTALPGFYVAIGTSGNQFKNAPVVGSYLHAIIAASENGVDHDATPVQVRLPHTGHLVDLATFSRRRSVNPDSSFTVMG